MILLVPVLGFVASEIPVVHRLLKCWATQIQSTRVVSITSTTTRSVFHLKSRLPPFSLVLSLASPIFIPYAAVSFPAARPAHRRRQCGRALTINPVVRRLSPRAACDGKKLFSFTTPETCEKGRAIPLLGFRGGNNTQRWQIIALIEVSRGKAIREPPYKLFQPDCPWNPDSCWYKTTHVHLVPSKRIRTQGGLL